jgi:hypothetical protein
MKETINIYIICYKMHFLTQQNCCCCLNIMRLLMLLVFSTLHVQVASTGDIWSVVRHDAAMVRRSALQKFLPTTQPSMNEVRKIVEHCTSYSCICCAAGSMSFHVTHSVRPSTREWRLASRPYDWPVIHIQWPQDGWSQLSALSIPFTTNVRGVSMWLTDTWNG